MTDGRPRPPKPLHLRGIEEDAMREPSAGIEPAALLEIIERPAIVDLLTEFVLVLGLREMGMQPDVELFGKLGGLAHQRGRHRKWRAWRQRDLHHCLLAALVMVCYDTRTIGEDGIFVLHDTVRRQAAVPLRAVHRAARQQDAHAEPFCYRNLDVDGILEAGREDIV